MPTVLKNFAYSTDGVNTHQASVGNEPNPPIPSSLIEGLEKEGFISLDGQKSQDGAPENKMNGGSPENKGGTAPADDKSDAFTAKHVGGGWWAVFSGEQKLDDVKRLSKEDGEAFNEMSPEDQAAFVEAEKAE